MTAIAAFAAGLAAALVVSDGKEGRAPSERTDEGSVRRSEATVAAARAVANAERLAAQLEGAQAENTALRARVRELTGEDAPDPAKARAKSEATDGAPRFVYRGLEKGLRSVDWRQAGKALTQLMPLLSEANDVAHGKKATRPELWGEITASLGPIITHAIKLDHGGVPWSHPSVSVNLVHATLLEAGQPLSDQQEASLSAIGSRVVAADDRRRAGYAHDTPKLQQLIGQVQIEDLLYAEVRGLLNGAQLAILYPPGVRGVVGLDVFSGATSFDEKLKHLPHKGRENLREKMVERVVEAFSLRPEIATIVGSLVAAWEADLPDEFALQVPTAAQKDEIDMQPTSRVLLAAQRQLALHNALLEQAPLTEDERRRVIEYERVQIPILRR